jgi:probable rRNA maturation factor
VPDGYLRQPVSNGVKKSGEITVCFVNDEKIRKLNLRYLGKSSSTDVLAFDMSTPQEANSIFADIVVSVDMAIHNASLFKTTPLYELCLYVIHGALHLLGYEDRTIKGRKLMQLKAETILAKLKINRKD